MKGFQIPPKSPSTATGSGVGESTIPCRFYSAGFCIAGDKCAFRHVPPGKVEKCKFYVAGTCKFGTSCSRSHGDPQAVEKVSEVDMLPLTLLRDLQLDGLSTDEKGTVGLPAGKDQETEAQGPSNDKDKPVSFGTVSFAELARRGAAERAPSSTTLTAAEFHSKNPKPAAACKTSQPMTVLAGFLAKSSDLCPFAVVGKCRYGNLCRNVHGLSCPRCLRYCLYPNDLEKNEEHIEECLGRQTISLPSDVKEIECGICLGRVAEKDDPRFGLLNCNHAFCLRCIRTWRAQHTMHDLATKSCPLCRVLTYFIIPSSTWTVDPTEKNKIIDAYKQKCSTIHCKYFSSGDGACPFGNSCFYAHRYRDGRPEQPVLRSYFDSDEKVQMLKEHRLCDFIDFQVNTFPSGDRSTPTNATTTGHHRHANK